jgi:hypothetical protein
LCAACDFRPAQYALLLRPAHRQTFSLIRAIIAAMEDFPIVPPFIVKDTPKPQRLTTLQQARDYVDKAMRVGRPAPWRELWHRLKTAATEEDAIEAIGDLRELLLDEDLLLPTGNPGTTHEP